TGTVRYLLPNPTRASRPRLVKYWRRCETSCPRKSDDWRRRAAGATPGPRSPRPTEEARRVCARSWRGHSTVSCNNSDSMRLAMSEFPNPDLPPNKLAGTVRTSSVPLLLEDQNDQWRGREGISP